MPSERDPRSDAYRPGARLREARLARGDTLEAASAALKLKPHLVEALETDDYAVLPEPVFVRGFMRNYAEWLGLPPEEVVARFESFYQAETGHAAGIDTRANPVRMIGEIGEDRLRLRAARARASRDWPIGGSVAIMALLLAALWFWKQGGKLPILVAPGAAAVASTEQSIAAGPLPVRKDRLVLTLSGDTGVEVRDAGGVLLATGAHHAGESLDLQGQSPFSIELSQAGVVRLALNGEDISLSPYTVNGAVNFRLSR